MTTITHAISVRPAPGRKLTAAGRARASAPRAPCARRRPASKAGAGSLAGALEVDDPEVRFRHQPSDRESGFPGGDFQSWSDAHPHATTYLSEDVSELRYRAEDGGYWLFVISEIMAGGRDGMAGRFADKVLVRFANSGEACVVETIPYRGGGFSRDPEADPIACPRR
ncbi:MAG TPA: hypothetical protein VGO55_17945 [Allosphingosinicella sp.]|nr:hypothetical protein [Allosphingosinicella sp.]